MTSPTKPLRLWPGVVAVVLQWLSWFVVPTVAPHFGIYGLFAGVLAAALILVWWLFLSRAPWSERIGAIAVMPVAVIATKRVVHRSIENGMMGNMTYAFSIPFLCLALVSWAVATRRLSSGPRRVSMVAAILLGCGMLALIRTGGISGEGVADLHWRWTPTPEERLLAQAREEPPDSAAAAPTAPPSTPAAGAVATPEPTVKPPAAEHVPASPAAKAAEKLPTPPKPEPPAVWPGFRGPNRDGIVHGVQIDTDWSKSPPVEMWRQKVGPGWSSFAVRGNLAYTQEQRGNDEDVSCYNLTTGKVVWRHRDQVRFYESNGGAGPRGTPTLSNGRVYTFGATGILNSLDADTGAVVWSRDAAADTGVEVPEWGFASSPLVVDDVVIVAASGRLAGYDVADGHRRWLGPTGGGGYSSPHLVTIDGVPQVVLLRGSRTVSVAPADGALLWEYTWLLSASIVQPAVASDHDLLISTSDAMGGLGMRRLTLAHGSGRWTVEVRWTSNGLKPYFNDYVVHNGHAFGFDNNILSCIDLEDGKRTWKGGRYGHGQLVLLADQDLLLVLSEDGELALVKATADQFTELARVPAIEGKTWNHPVLAGNVLLVRNGEEMAAFKLSLAAPHDRTTR